jgi:hypothetical protein
MSFKERQALHGVRDGVIARLMLTEKTGFPGEQRTANLDLLRLALIEARSSGVDRYSQGIFLPYEHSAVAGLWKCSRRLTAAECIELANQLWALANRRTTWVARLANERLIAENSGWELHLRSILDEWSAKDSFAFERELDSINQVRMGILILGLAVRAYQLQTGRLPASLDELIPSQLPSIPDDPYSNGQPLKYRLSGNDFQLYSVGPNRVDDGGAPPSKGANPLDGDLTDAYEFPAIPGATTVKSEP